MSEPYTSKKILGQPSEPELVKRMMKTKLFKHSKQAGVTLIVLSLLCWIGVVFITLPYITDLQDEQDILNVNNADPVFLEAVKRTKNPSEPKNEDLPEETPETLELI